MEENKAGSENLETSINELSYVINEYLIPIIELSDKLYQSIDYSNPTSPGNSIKIEQKDQKNPSTLMERLDDLTEKNSYIIHVYSK
jgi:hypothetical protein